MDKKEIEKLEKLVHAKVLIDYKDYSWLLESYKDLLEDMNILRSKEMKKAEEEVEKGKLYPWEKVKHALRL